MSLSSELGSPACVKLKKHGVSSVEVGAEPSSNKRVRSEPETNDDCDDQKPSADPHGDLALALQRKAQALADIDAAEENFLFQEAQRRLGECIDDIEKARRDIRARGEAEFDSLLVVGNDSISHILAYVNDAKQLCLCELTCKAFQRMSAEGWSGMDKETCPNKSITANSPKGRCVRYVVASEYAQKMEKYASSHRWSDYRDCYREYSHAPQTVRCDVFKQNVFPNDDNLRENAAACDFPDELATVDKLERELFLRIRANRSKEILMEGFFPLRSLPILGICLDLCSAHCPNWPEMENFLSIQRLEPEERDKIWNASARRIKSTMERSVTVTLVTLTERNEPSLVTSVDRFRPIDSGTYRYIERTFWQSLVFALMPITPHHVQRSPNGLIFQNVKFGWSSTKDIVGFFLDNLRMP